METETLNPMGVEIFTMDTEITHNVDSSFYMNYYPYDCTSGTRVVSRKCFFGRSPAEIALLRSFVVVRS
jgi:hypothetical protein